MPEYAQNPDIGEIVSPVGFGRGYQNYRVVYTAGYSTIPNPIQQACAAPCGQRLPVQGPERQPDSGEPGRL